MPWKPEVEVEGKWIRNLLVFETKEEAEISARDLYGRWFSATGCRAIEVDESHLVNRRMDAHKGCIKIEEVKND